jgi:lipoate synthase
MNNTSTILLEKGIIELLKKAKESPRETYNEVIEKIVRVFLKFRKRSQYDEFLHKIQQPKMKEIWDNKEDEIWENV